MSLNFRTLVEDAVEVIEAELDHDDDCDDGAIEGMEGDGSTGEDDMEVRDEVLEFSLSITISPSNIVPIWGVLLFL